MTTAAEQLRPGPIIEKGKFKVGRKTFRYKVNGEPARSVTEILEWIDGKGKFGAGAWWGQEQGVKGTLRLIDEGCINLDLPADDATHIAQVVKLLKHHKLTVNHVRDAAADRGTAVHDAAEQCAMLGVVPNPGDFPPEQRGYVQAFAKWVVDYDPTFVATEVVVASPTYQYAGTYDIRCKIGDRLGLGDYKTSKRLYNSVFLQLEAYEVASIECGQEPTDFRFAVRLGADGEYEYEESVYGPGDWIAQVEAYRCQVDADARRRAAK